jgi:hypothetical protein
MPLLADRNQVAIKQEAVAGTAETLAAGNVILTTDRPTWEPTPIVTERMALTRSFDSRGVVIGSRMAKIGFKMYLRGTSTAPLVGNPSDFTVPFKGCGLDVVYSGANPNEIATWGPSVTIATTYVTGSNCSVALYRDGKQYLIHGAVGNVKLTFSVGIPVLAEFSFEGCLNTPTDVALLSPTYSTVVEPPFLGAVMTVTGYATARLKGITLDVGNVIGLRPSPNTTTGCFAYQIGGRKVTFTVDPEEELAATKNWWNEWLTGALASITTGVFPSNGTNYNQFNLTIPNAQYTKGTLGDRDTITTAALEGVARANTDAGEDSFSLVQT